MGPIEVIVIYAPHNLDAEVETWVKLLSPTRVGGHKIVCGDFNAHSPSWGSHSTNNRENKLASAMEECNFIPLNDYMETYIPLPGEAGSNLDLILCSPSLVPVSTFYMGQDSYQSDHIPVIVKIITKPAMSTSRSHRLNTNNVNWTNFRERADIEINSIEFDTTVQSPVVTY